MIKPVLDSLRSAAGFEGVVVYHRGAALLADGIDADSIADLFGLLAGGRPGQKRYLVAGGYTFHGLTCGSYFYVVKQAGRFVPPPALAYDEPDFVDPDPLSGLPSRDVARRAAEALLRGYRLDE